MRRSLPKPRPVAHAHWGCQNGSGTGVRICEHPSAKSRAGSHARDLAFQLDKAKLKAAELRDGHYLLRTNLVAEDRAALWDRYTQLTHIEAACKCLKSELGIRPMYHQLEHRAEAHILVAFLAYCLSVTLKHRLAAYAPGLTSRAVLEKLAAIQVLDVVLPTSDGRTLVMPRHTAGNR
jgi:hypothetical protein